MIIDHACQCSRFGPIQIIEFDLLGISQPPELQGPGKQIGYILSLPEIGLPCSYLGDLRSLPHLTWKYRRHRAGQYSGYANVSDEIFQSTSIPS